MTSSNRVDRNTTHIGKLLVTKAIGKSTHDPKIKVKELSFKSSLQKTRIQDWEDVTLQYKKKEGSKEMKR